jgi:hypothetical protein
MGKRTAAVVLALTMAGAVLGFATSVADAAKPTCPPRQTCPPPPPPTPGRCVVWLHGQGGGTQPSETVNGITYVYPGGNDDDPNTTGSGRRWLYYGDQLYLQAVGVVQGAITANGCTKVVIDGFSNGGAFAGKLLCRGETFGGVVVGYVVDDPVTDGAVLGCARVTSNVSMYWTGALDYAEAGWDCAANGWTCETPTLIGSTAYASSIGAPKLKSPNRRHKPYTWPPEVAGWLGA